MAEAPIFYFTRIVPHYRIPVLEALNDALMGRLVVCAGHAPPTSSIRSLIAEHPQSYRRHILQNYWFLGEKLHAQPYKAAFQEFGLPAVALLEEAPRSITLPFLMRYASKRNVGTVLWGHFSSNNRAFSPQNPQDQYRLMLAKRADACVCYTDPIAELIRPYLPGEKVFVARNTIDMGRLFTYYEALLAEGKPHVRRRLGLSPEAPTIVFIGRLLAEKRTDLLLDLFKRLRTTREATLLIIGDGPEKASMQQRVSLEQIEGVYFLGTLSEWEDSAPYLFAADVMLMPGYLGLAVNHAFAFGVPVVSQAAPAGIRFHSPEVAFVRHDENGMLAEYGNPDALFDALCHVLDDQSRFALNALAYAKTHLTLPTMVNGLVDAIKYAEEKCQTRPV